MVVLAIGFVLLVSLVLGVALRASLDFTARFVPAVDMLISGAEMVLSFVVVTLLFATIFKVLPDVVLKWRQVIVGGMITALLFSLGRYSIAAYLAYTAPAARVHTQSGASRIRWHPRVTPRHQSAQQQLPLLTGVLPLMAGLC